MRTCNVLWAHLYTNTYTYTTASTTKDLMNKHHLIYESSQEALAMLASRRKLRLLASSLPDLLATECAPVGSSSEVCCGCCSSCSPTLEPAEVLGMPQYSVPAMMMAIPRSDQTFGYSRKSRIPASSAHTMPVYDIVSALAASASSRPFVTSCCVARPQKPAALLQTRFALDSQCTPPVFQ